jgi:hypothetical protein
VTRARALPLLLVVLGGCEPSDLPPPGENPGPPPPLMPTAELAALAEAAPAEPDDAVDALQARAAALRGRTGTTP